MSPSTSATASKASATPELEAWIRGVQKATSVARLVAITHDILAHAAALLV